MPFDSAVSVKGKGGVCFDFLIFPAFPGLKIMKKKVLIGCEESQAVCIEFRKLGVEAYSCDLEPCSGGYPEWHLQMDVFEAIKLKNWDAGIFFPPCTYLSNAGIGHFNIEKYGQKAIERFFKRIEAFKFAMKCFYSEIPLVAMENPVGWINTAFRPPDQTIEPYFFGDNHKKRTCLWLKNLPKLIHIKESNLFEVATHLPKPAPLSVEYRNPSKYYKGGEVKNRYFTDVKSSTASKERSKTFPGIARAMAEQWSELL